MKRSTFLLVSAIVGVLFAALMLLMPDMAAENFGLPASPQTSLLFRDIGGMILGIAILNFMVRNERPSATMRAVLVLNILVHVIGMANNLYAASQDVLPLSKIMGGQVVHLLIAVGAFIYLVRMKSAETAKVNA